MIIFIKIYLKISVIFLFILLGYFLDMVGDILKDKKLFEVM